MICLKPNGIKPPVFGSNLNRYHSGLELPSTKPAGIEPALEGSDLNDCDSGLKLTSNDLFKARWNQARCAGL